LESLLDAAEQSRVAAMRRRADRHRFVVAAALARAMVAESAGTDPAGIRLDRTCAVCGGPHGKPRVTGDGAPLELTVSHSGDRVVAAVALGKPLGVDVECAPPLTAALLDCVDGVLCADELRRVRALAPDERPTGFLTYWTRKEAVVKAVGEGLRVPLNSFAVTGPREPGRIVSWPARPHLVRQTTLIDLHPGTGYVASLAVLGAVTRVVEFPASGQLAAI
jgi:4'-phosphopantetheinyl transferase